MDQKIPFWLSQWRTVGPTSKFVNRSHIAQSYFCIYKSKLHASVHVELIPSLNKIIISGDMTEIMMMY